MEISKKTFMMNECETRKLASVSCEDWQLFVCLFVCLMRFLDLLGSHSPQAFLSGPSSLG